MEIALADNSKKNAANVQFNKLQRAEDGKRAMLEYEAAAAANRAKTAAAQALRLARDAEIAANPEPEPVKKPAKEEKASRGLVTDQPVRLALSCGRFRLARIVRRARA